MNIPKLNKGTSRNHSKDKRIVLTSKVLEIIKSVCISDVLNDQSTWTTKCDNIAIETLSHSSIVTNCSKIGDVNSNNICTEKEQAPLIFLC